MVSKPFIFMPMDKCKRLHYSYNVFIQKKYNELEKTHIFAPKLP